MLSYAFDAEKETPESAKRRRALAEAIMGRTMSPQNVGEGFGALASGFVANVQNRRAGEAEQAGRSSANDTYTNLIRGITGGSPAYTPSGAGGGGAGGGAVGAVNGMAASGDMNPYREAIASIESAGSGDYAAIGPTHPKLGRAMGRYQVMEANIGPWSRQVLGREVTPDEFMANPQLQDAIFDGIFGGYVEKFGPEGAAQAWFAGPGGVGKMGRQDSLGTSVAAYTDKFNNAYGGGGAPRTQVASLDPGAGMNATGPRTPDVSANTVPWSDPGAVVQSAPPVTNPQTGFFDPEMNMPAGQGGGIDIPGVTGGQQPSNGLPPNAAPGTVAQGADGQTYQFAETTGMAGATGANGWIPYNGGGQTPQQREQVAQGPSLEELLMASQNPWLSDEQRGVVNTLIETQLQRQDPRYQQQLQQGDLNLQKSQFELDQLMNPGPGPSPMSPEEMAMWGIPEGSGSWTIGENGTPEQIFTPQAAPNSVQEYEYYVQQAQAQGEQPVPYIEWDTARKAAGATNISNVVGGGETGPKLGSLSSDYGYVLDPETGQPVIDPDTGLPTAAPVPGSPAAREIEEAAAQAESRAGQTATQAGTVVQDTGIAIGIIDELEGLSADEGPIGANWRALQSGIRGTPEYRSQRFVNSALANVGFDQLNQMRQNSPTGGALGNVTELQLRQLESVLGQYDSGLSPDEQQFILKRISNVYADITFGSRAERAQAVREGKMTQEEADRYDQYYYPETRDAMGRPIEQGAPPNQSQPNPDVVDFSDYF